MGANARSDARAHAASVGVTLDGLMCLVEPGTTNRPGGIRKVSAAAGNRDMPIGVEEYEVRATLDATFSFNVGDDARAPAAMAPTPEASREHQPRS